MSGGLLAGGQGGLGIELCCMTCGGGGHSGGGGIGRGKFDGGGGCGIMINETSLSLLLLLLLLTEELKESWRPYLRREFTRLDGCLIPIKSAVLWIR